MTSLSSLCRLLLRKHNNPRANNTPTTTRPTTTNVPATAPVLLKNEDEPDPPPLELSSAPVGLCTMTVLVMIEPFDSVTISEVYEDGVWVMTAPLAPVEVTTRREDAVSSEVEEEAEGVTMTVEVWVLGFSDLQILAQALWAFQKW